MRIGVASQPLAGQPESGDAYLARELPAGSLFAVVDGLGHGPEAAASAKAAMGVLEEHAGAQLPDLFLRCHQRLRTLRGVVMTLAWVTPDGQVTWLGVGNVRAMTVAANRPPRQSRDELLSRAGIVGRDLPALRAATSRLYDGDLLLLATDGVRPDFAVRSQPGEGPQAVAQRVLDEFASGRDDALVLAVAFGRGGL